MSDEPVPRFLIYDETDSPRMRLIVTCNSCRAVISDHPLDVSQPSIRNDPDFGAGLANDDIVKWLDHVKKVHQSS